MADKKPAVLGATAFKPVERHGWEAVRYLIHNPETGEFFTRTPKSWALITGFYIIYYSCLAAFWAAMLMIFFTTLQDDKPKWIGAESLIGTCPGVGLNPKQTPELIDSSMIVFNKESAADIEGTAAKVAGYGKWSERARDYVNEMKFDKAQLGACGDFPHGYDGTGVPCMFLKLNKIYGVSNVHYTDAADFPEDMPENLKEHIKAQADKEQVWVDCHGEYPADIEALGEPEYFPKSRGFPGTYFPYMNNADYVSPVVAVRFPMAKPNQLLHVECRVWAKNIAPFYSKRDRIGLNHFELMILDNESANKIANGEN